jgi:4'-phosphopantetheinyl transferase EntD
MTRPVASPFETAWVRATRFGTLAAVPLPAGLEPVPGEALARLHPREAALATAERGRRQIELAGGRLAWRAAAAHLGIDPDFALLADSGRVPLAPPGLSVSLTHKEDLALALVARDTDGLVGVDLEGGARDRSSIRTRVCRPEELREVDALPEADRWPNVMVRFAVKEAVYKAIAPRLGRFFGFQAARVDVLSREAAQVTMFLEPSDPSFEVECALEWLDDGRLLAMVRARVTSTRR